MYSEVTIYRYNEYMFKNDNRNLALVMSWRTYQWSGLPSVFLYHRGEFLIDRDFPRSLDE